MHRIRGMVLVVVGLSCAACFLGRDTGPRVLGLRNSTVVLTNQRSYQVGPVPAGWQVQRSMRHAVILTNPASKAKMTTSIQCGTRREDLPLTVLMGHLFSGLTALDVPHTSTLQLDGRAALRSRSRRVVDGVPVQCDAVVLKKDRCTFDFILVTPERDAATVTPLFEAFFGGFTYRP